MANQKEATKNRLAKLRDDYLSAIYEGLSKGDGIRQIHKSLKEATIRSKKEGGPVCLPMLKAAMVSASSLSKRMLGHEAMLKSVSHTHGKAVAEGMSPTELASAFAFELMRKRKTERRLSKEITKEADRVESESKAKTLEEIFNESFKGSMEESSRTDDPDTSKLMLFYLASQHKDSAEDHAPYQGKMYIDEKWESLSLPTGIKNAIANYVRRYNVKTVQWVTCKPVWFITRPNCRHYFQNLSVKDVLGASRTKLLEANSMETAIGDRQYLQTLSRAKSKDEFDEVRNAQILLRKYKERLRTHRKLYESSKNELVGKAIDKDRMLIRKWESFLESKRGIAHR